MPTLLVSFAGTTLTINYQGRIAARVVDHLYRHVSTADICSSTVGYHLSSDDSCEGLRLQREETLLYKGNCAGTLAESLLGDSCNQLAVHCRTGTLFHAAALSRWGHTFILPGRSGAGKSTLTAWLVSQGFDYLTDELVFIPWETNTIEGFTRPLSLKKPARSVLCDHFNFEKQEKDILSSTYIDLVPPTLLYRSQLPHKAPLTLIIFPCYQANHAFELRQLSKAQAGLTLMQTLINARNLPEHGFSEITRLVRHIPAHTMRYSTFAQVETHLKGLLG